MKTRFWILVMMMCVTVVTFSACSDDDNDDKSINVPEAVAQALKQKYPSATDVEWEQKGSYYVADCGLDSKDSNIWFDANGNWWMTESEIYWNDVPGAVQTAFNNGEYANWVQDDYYFLMYPLQPMQYVIEVKQGNLKYQLFYSEDGGLMNTVDVTGKDDTIYPPISEK